MRPGTTVKGLYIQILNQLTCHRFPIDSRANSVPSCIYCHLPTAGLLLAYRLLSGHILRPLLRFRDIGRIWGDAVFLHGFGPGFLVAHPGDDLLQIGHGFFR